ncbi:RDD family protein [Niabella aurantiaca]|uniref:RDD family protein n=1 Tax=Niabella aurantiaca TaxID=379900 RepID=UPI0004758D93|nr:RDD family protein [Niabella aurantiaca]
MTYPKVIDRIQSSLIDLGLLVLLMFAAAMILDRYEQVPDAVKIGIFIFLIIYEPLLIALGCTLGNYIKGIRVRQSTDPLKKIGFAQSLLRYPVKLFLGLVSFFTIGASKQRRAIHDILSGSVMIKL